MTKEEFEANWATGSGFSIQDLRDLNIWAIPCDCNAPGCQGWQMYTQEYTKWGGSLRCMTSDEGIVNMADKLNRMETEASQKKNDS